MEDKTSWQITHLCIQVEFGKTTAKAGCFYMKRMPMRKWINDRPILFWTLSFIAGILLSFCIICGLWWIAVVFSVALTTVFILCRKNSKALTKIALLTASFMLGTLVFWANYVNILSMEVESSPCVVTGVFTDRVYDGNNYMSVVLRDCSVTLADGTQINVDVNVILFDEEQIDLVATGYKATFYGEISYNYIFKDGVDSYTYKNDVYYTVTSVNGLTVSQGQPTLAEKCRLYILQTLTRYCPETADLSYALIIGDKSFVDGNDMQSFRTAGIAHLLAVSGLHVGFIVGIFEFIFEKFKVHPLKRLAVSLPLLLFYAYLCGFPASVMRAVVMAVCVQLCRFAFRKVDLLTSLAAACIVILSVKPLYLFDAGFLLSVSAVYGIATFTAATNRLIKRRFSGFTAKILTSLSVSFGATVGTMGWSLYFYGYLPVFGTLVNLVAIPVVSVAFICIVAGLIPVVGQIFLFVSDKLILFVLAVARAVSSASASALVLPSIGIATVIIGIWLFVYGGYVNFKGKEKLTVHCLLALIFLCSCIYSFIPQDAGTRIFINETYGDSCVVAVNNGEVAVISNLQYGETDKIVSTMNFKYESLSLYVTDFTNVRLSAFQLLNEQRKINSVYVLDTSGNIAVERYCENQSIDVVRVPKNYFSGNDVKVRSIWDGSLVGALVVADDMSLAVVTTDNSLLYGNLALNLKSIPTALMCSAPTADMLKDFENSYIFTTYMTDKNIYSSNRCGNFTLIQKDGKILLKL